MLVKQIITVLSIVFKIVILQVKAGLSKKNNDIIFVPEFSNEGGALTYFKYVVQYFQESNIRYFLVLSESEKEIIKEKIALENCLGIIDKPEVWRPFFTSKNSLKTNLRLLNNQLQELVFFSSLNVKFKPAYFMFSVTNPEHYIFEFFLASRVIYVCHTSPADKIDKLKQRVLSWNLGLSKKIVAVSKFEKDEMINSWSIDSNKSRYIEVIHNYYSLRPCNEASDANKFSSPIRILTIGSLEYYKNPLQWISIAKKVTKSAGPNQVAFFWVGSGSLYQTCLNECRDEGNIHFEGHQDSVDEYYRRSHIYFQPSKYESFGISAVGAMAHRLPCIVSNAGGLKEIFFEESCGVVVCSDSEEEYVSNMVEFIYDKSKRLHFGQKGYDVYSKNYMKKDWKQKMDSLLSSIRH